MIQGNDGGANVSFNAGSSWSSIHNQLTAQLYTVDTDGRRPHYFVYGTQQDNSSIGVPSGTNDGAIAWSDCRIAGTGESGYVAVHPGDPDVVYVGAIGSSPGGGGALQRYDHRTGQVRLVNVWPEAHGGIGPGELRYRFGWTFPIRFSPHDPDVLYACGNRVFRSTDEGQTWEPISPDLTRAAPDKLGPSGGPITRDTSGAEHYCTLYTFAESLLEPGVLWAGSDDGLVHLSRDGGKSWSDVTPPDLPTWAFIRTVEPSPHDAGTLYLAATRYKLDDPSPYLYRTADYGESWQSITGSDGDQAIPGDDFVRVIRADPGCPGVLYVGTETGLYASLDDGAAWRRWRSNLPVTPVYDLEVEGTDLVIATHGRSFWILDDLTPLRQFAALRASGGRGVSYSPENGFRWSLRAHHHDIEVGVDDTRPDDFGLLSPPRSAWRLLPGVMDFITAKEGKDYSVGLGKPATFVAARDDSGQVERSFLDAGESAPAGAIVYYYLPEFVPADRTASDPASVRCRLAEERYREKYGVDPAREPTSAAAVAAVAAEDGISASLAFLDERGNVIREFRPKPAGYDKLSDEDKALDPGPWMPVRAGVNRYVWDLRYPGAKRLRGNKTGEEADRGPLVLPGTYRVRLQCGCQEPVSRPSRGRSRPADVKRCPFAKRTDDGAGFEVVNDSRSPATLEELREQLRLLLDIRDNISAAYDCVQRIRETTGEVERWCARLSRREGHEAALEVGNALREQLAEIESDLILPGEHTDTVGLHHRVRLGAALASVISIVDSADARPTAQARALAEEYMARIDDVLDRGRYVLTHVLGAFNDLVSEAGLPPIDSN